MSYLAKIKVSAGLHSSGSFMKKKMVSLSSLAFRDQSPIFLGSWFFPPSSKPAHKHLSDPASSLKDPCDYVGSTQTIQDNLTVLRSINNLNSTCNLNYLLPCNLTYLRVQGIRICTYLGAIILPSRVHLLP